MSSDAEVLVLPPVAPETLLPSENDVKIATISHDKMNTDALNVKSYSFSAPAEEHTFDGILFDMDGTLIDSTRAIELHWESLGKILNMDPKVILATSHGRRSIDTLAEIAPSLANWEYISALEAAIPRTHASTARLLPGAAALLASLTARSAPWTIVTSGTRALVHGWLAVLGLAAPAAGLVAAEDVARGKPDAGCYLLGRERIGLGIKDGEGEDAGEDGKGKRVLVVEDAPAGVRAGVAAGAEVLGLATTHGVEALRAAGARWVVRDLGSVRVVEGEGVRVEIRDAVV